MGSKQDPGLFDCHAAALPDEPMFILLGRDPLAPFLTSIWSAVRMADWEKAGVVFDTMLKRAGDQYAAAPDVDKAIEAMSCSTAMFEWRKRNEGVWRAATQETEQSPKQQREGIRG